MKSNKPGQSGKRYTNKEKRAALKMVTEGYTATDVATAIGCTPKTIINWEKGLGFKNKKEAKSTNIHSKINASIPEVETMRKQMFNKLQEEFVSLSAIVEEADQKRQIINKQMLMIGEQWH